MLRSDAYIYKNVDNQLIFRIELVVFQSSLAIWLPLYAKIRGIRRHTGPSETTQATRQFDEDRSLISEVLVIQEHIMSTENSDQCKTA